MVLFPGRRKKNRSLGILVLIRLERSSEFSDRHPVSKADSSNQEERTRWWDKTSTYSENGEACGSFAAEVSLDRLSPPGIQCVGHMSSGDHHGRCLVSFVRSTAGKKEHP